MRERDQQRLRQLQQTLADLEQQEKQMTSERLHRDLHATDSTRFTHTQVIYTHTLYLPVIPQLVISVD